MGLASALSTALTGLNASETTIDVVGNNVANSNTVGFKSSKAVFATQFLQTSSLGSGPTDTRGGTNPRQVGLGTKVSEITPDFTQGTIQVSSSPSDLAIQGDGFFIVEGGQNEQLYTRNGSFKTNSKNELVTTNGQRLLGLGVDSNFEIQNTGLVPITIPLGSAVVAQATQNVNFAGTLSPTGDVATDPGVITSAAIGDGSKAIPPDLAPTDLISLVPPLFSTTPADSGAAGLVPAGTYTYKITQVTADGAEGPPSNASSAITTTGDSVTLNPLPLVSAGFSTLNVYRADATGVYKQVATGVAGGSSFTDNVAAGTTALPETLAQGNYAYYVTFYNSADGSESRPTALVGPQSVTVDGRRIELKNLPTPTPPYDSIRVYRNSVANTDTFHLVTTPALTGTAAGFLAGSPTTFIDGLNDTTWAAQPSVNLDNPPINLGTKLVDVIKRSGSSYDHLFTEGTIDFTGKKGGRTLATKEFQVTATSTVGDLVSFMQDSLGIRTDIADPNNPAALLSAGGNLNASTGKISFTSNGGTGNEVEVGLSAFKFTPTGGTARTVDLGFSSTQQAVGTSVVSDLVAYDSLGIAVQTRITAVLESRTNENVTYRWYADSPDNQVQEGTSLSPKLSVGTGQIIFDSAGNVQSVTNDTVAIGRAGTSSSDLEYKLDFSALSGLATSNSSLAATRQDGSAPGVLTSFIIGENGLVRGVFSNGISRDLGQIELARFANNAGLEQKGENLFATGVNSGLPIIDNPGKQGIGSIVAGAQELSNTDIGQNLIDLITASTAYRGGARVITTVQQLFDELLNLRR